MKNTPRLALFDLDNTLLEGDSDYAWAQYLIEEGVLHPEEYHAKNEWFFERYKDGTLDIHEFLDFQLAPIAGVPRAKLDAWHAEFMQRKIRPMIFPKAVELIESHADALTAIVTATNRFITAPIAAELGVPNLLATDIEEVDGVFTGKARGVPTFREGKIRRVREWLAGARHGARGLRELVLQRLAERPAAARARDAPGRRRSRRDAARPRGRARLACHFPAGGRASSPRRRGPNGFPPARE